MSIRFTISDSSSLQVSSGSDTSNYKEECGLDETIRRLGIGC